MALPLTVVALCCSLPVYGIIRFWFGDAIDNWRYQRKFDAVLWKANAWDSQKKRQVYDGDWPPRQCMVDDLMASRRLLGMPKSEVFDLLGPPDNSPSPHRHYYSYYLGRQRRGFIRLDPEELVIEFGDDGKLSRHWIYGD